MKAPGQVKKNGEYLKRTHFNKNNACFTLLTLSFFLFFTLSVVLLSRSTSLASVTISPAEAAIFFKAQKFAGRGDYSKAAGIIEDFCYKNKKEAVCSPELMEVLGNCLVVAGEYDRAIDVFRDVLRLKPDSPDAWSNLGKALYSKGAYIKASKAFTRAFDASNRQEPECLYFSGVSLLLAGKAHKAAEVLKELLAIFPQKQKTEWNEALARALVSDNRHMEALPLIEKIAATVSENKKKEWNQLLLNEYFILNMIPRANRLSTRLARLYPHENIWWKAVASSALGLNDVNQALMAMIIISYLRELSPSEERLLADLYLHAGIPAQALPIYQNMLTHKPSARLIKLVAHAMCRIDRPADAIAFLEAQHETVKSDAVLLMLEADLLYQTKKFQAAMDRYAQAARIKGKHQGRAWLMAGYCAVAGNPDDAMKAREYFEKAATFPDQKTAALKALRFFKGS